MAILVVAVNVLETDCQCDMVASSNFLFFITTTSTHWSICLFDCYSLYLPRHAIQSFLLFLFLPMILVTRGEHGGEEEGAAAAETSQCPGRALEIFAEVPTGSHHDKERCCERGREGQERCQSE